MSQKEKEAGSTKPVQQDETFADTLDHQLEETISRSEAFIETYKNKLLAGLGILLLVFGAYYYVWHIYLPGQEQEAQEQAYMAQRWFENDSLDLAIKGKGQYAGFETIADEYGMTKIGKLSHYYLGIAYLRKGKFQEAIDELDKFSSDDMMLAAVALGAKGDAMLELGQKEDALAQYEKAASTNENRFTTPIYLQKAAELAENLGQKEKALEIFNRLKDEYKETNEGMNAEKYIARIQAK
jgi:tetratricopeptide (TPR) repeat protein